MKRETPGKGGLAEKKEISFFSARRENLRIMTAFVAGKKEKSSAIEKKRASRRSWKHSTERLWGKFRRFFKVRRWVS